MDEFGSGPCVPVFKPRKVDRLFRWSPGTALRLARLGVLPHLRRDGKIRFDEGVTLTVRNHYRSYTDDQRFVDAFSEQDILEMALQEMARMARRPIGMANTSIEGEDNDCEE